MLIGCVVLIGACVGWLAVQNERYESRLDAAYEPVMEAFRRTRPGLDEKNAIIAKHQPGVVNAVQIPEVIYEIEFLPDMRRQFEAMRALEPPPLWRSYHGALVTLQRTRVAAFETQYAQLRYADEFLGDGDSIERIAALATDSKYVDLGREARRAINDANRAATSFNAAEPRVASWIPGSPDTDENSRMKARWTSTGAISSASDCAQAELDGEPAPSRDCAGLLRYVPIQPECLVSTDAMVSTCSERAIPCPPSTDPDAPNRGPDGLPLAPTVRAAPAPASVCG